MNSLLPGRGFPCIPIGLVIRALLRTIFAFVEQPLPYSGDAQLHTAQPQSQPEQEIEPG
ncbi:MAG: hypothetical protein LH647_08740 [Leptolyngbyaceae cyanobacterium CAN_BIN12]|nr:hypothetical protein [Leptolyngbyaceae cyanobacterium CAN_BIN12]